MKSGRPVLYELMSSRHAAPVDTPTNGHAHRLEPHLEEETWAPQAHAGRSMRVPVGYVFVAAAIVIMAAAVTYMIGFARGRDNERSQSAESAAAFNEVREIVNGQPGGEGRNEGSGGVAQPPRAPSTAGGGGKAMGAVESDPRVAGLNYFTLIHTSRSNAVTVAEFCREHGLEAHVVRAKDQTFRVFVLPGLTGDELTSDRGEAIKRKIDEVATRWEARFGKDELSGYFPQKFGG